MSKDEVIDALWENSNHGTRREDVEAAYTAGAAAERGHMKALQYLKLREWSMGDGQCPDCFGVPASWHGHLLYMTSEAIGHEATCTLAAALLYMGETPLMKGEFKSDAEFERFIDKYGFLGTRTKTADGCPLLAAERLG